MLCHAMPCYTLRHDTMIYDSISYYISNTFSETRFDHTSVPFCLQDTCIVIFPSSPNRFQMKQKCLSSEFIEHAVGFSLLLYPFFSILWTTRRHSLYILFIEKHNFYFIILNLFIFQSGRLTIII